ncbi:MAG: alcohol dehydrogenase [Thermoprotei archaeon]|nr:MAG: alcohol dehydrogenase [Thermoprotei archaeon]
MRALVLYGPSDLRLEEIDDPLPPRNWIRIRVERVGICGTDKAFYKGSYKPLKIPIIPGHEISGIVDEVGEEVNKDLIGRRVTTEINVYCGKCWYCINGLPTHCPYRSTIGISIDGGMAEYVLTRADLVHIVDDLSPLEVAFVEPLAAVVEMIETYPIPVNANVAVIGIGTIGLLSLRLIKTLNPRLLVAVSRPDSPKIDHAKRSGADFVVSFNEALEIMHSETPEGVGFDYVVEATGSPKGLDMAIELVRPRGVIAAKSTHGAPVSFNYTMLVVKEVKIVGSRCGPFEKAIKLLRTKQVMVSDLVTSTYSLDEGVEAFIKSFDRKEVKVHITP